MYGYIYKTTNLVNNKIYIGQHHASIFEPNRYIGSGLLITEAINKYGFDNFKCELLAECESAEELNNLEQFYIKKFNSQNLEIGYNIAAGGKNVIKFGETNGNCRSDLNRCNYAKQLLDSGLSIAAVAKEARLSKSIVSRIRRGMH